MASGNITTRTNLTTPTPTMLHYAGLSPFGVTDDRKITGNALFQEITANITDLTLGFGNGAAGTVSAAGKGKIRYNNTTQTFQTSVNGGAYSSFLTGHTVEANNVVTDFGAQAGGVFDNTAIFATAIASCQSTGKQLFIPAGTYLGNIVIPGFNSIRIFGEGPGRSIIQSATGASPVLFADNASGLTHTLTIEELSLNCFGSGADDYGFRMSPDQPFDLTLRNVRINNVAQSGVYIPTNAFTMLFEGVDVSVLPAGLHGFDVFGDNTVTFVRCYVHAVGTNGTAYRLHSGRFSLIGCNGIDSGTTASWGVFGDVAAEDGADAYSYVSLIGSNVEAWTLTSYAVRVKAVSRMSVYNTHFITGVGITTAAILFDNADPNNDGNFSAQLDALTAFTLGAGASWTNGFPIHSRGVPFLMDGNRSASYYDTNLAATVLMPYRSTALNAADFRGAYKINRLALGTAANEGFDGDLHFINDNTRAIGTAIAGRPNIIYVGTGGVHLGAGSVAFDGTNFALTGGTSPALVFNDGTISGRFQLLTTVGIQFGTTTAHPLNLLSNNILTWHWDSSGNLLADATVNIGAALGNRPAIGYFETSVNIGIPTSVKGALVFGNASNSFTQTLESANTPAATNRFLWPAADPTIGQVLSASAPAAGVVTLSWAAAGSGGTPGGSTTQVQYNSAGTFGGSTGITLTATQATITGARFVGSLRDANDLILIAPTATTSAVNYFTMANSATGQPVIFGTAGSDTRVPLRLNPKGTTFPNGPQIIVPPNSRFDDPVFVPSDFPSSGIGWGAKAGGSGFEVTFAKLIFNGNESEMQGTAVLSWGTTGAGWASTINTPDDNPPGRNTGLEKGAAAVVGFVGFSGDPSTSYQGGTWRARALTPAQITSNQNNYNPGGTSYYLRLSTDASRDVTGLTFTDSQVDGQTHEIWNTGSFNIVLKHDVTSTAANRFSMATAADVTLTPGQGAKLWYDANGGTLRWRVVALGGASASGITINTTTITGGTTARLLYDNAGTVGEISGLTSNGSTTLTQTSNSATAFESGPNGGTNPVFRLVNNVASAATGLSVTGNAAGNGVILSSLSSAASEAIVLRPKSATNPTLTIADDTAGRIIITGSGGTLSIIASGAAIVQIGNVWTFSGASGAQTAINPAFPLNFGTVAGIVGITSTNTMRLTNTSTGAGSLLIGTSAGAIGTSGAGVLAWALSTAPSTSPADTVQLYSQDAAAGDHNTYWRNEAGEITRATGLACRVSTQFDATTTTLASVTSLTRNVEAGRIYAFEAWLFVDADVVGGSKYAIAGTATATAIKYQITLMDNSTNALTINTRQTSLAGASGQAGTTAGLAVIRGTITVNAAGTLTVQFAQNAAAGTSSVLTQSSFNLIPIG